MKRVIFLTFSLAMILSSCASIANDSDSRTTQTTAMTQNYTIPSRETFAELPEEQVSTLDYAIEAVDNKFPKESGIKRYYGYMGEETVDGGRCFVFGVYDQSAEGQAQIATAAVSEDNSKVYVLDEASHQYSLIKTFSEKKVPDEYSWVLPEPTSAEDSVQ